MPEAQPIYNIDKINEIVGNNIRSIREEQGMTQEELANNADIDRSYIGRIENGRVNASIKTMCKIANVMKVRISEIINM